MLSIKCNWDPSKVPQSAPMCVSLTLWTLWTPTLWPQCVSLQLYVWSAIIFGATALYLEQTIWCSSAPRGWQMQRQDFAPNWRDRRALLGHRWRHRVTIGDTGHRWRHHRQLQLETPSATGSSTLSPPCRCRLLRKLQERSRVKIGQYSINSCLEIEFLV